MGVRVLGRIDAVGLGDAPVPVGRDASRRILGHLAAVAPATASPQALIETAWGAGSGAAISALRMAITRLRRALELAGDEATIISARSGYGLAPAVYLDSRQFESLIVGSRHSRSDAGVVHILGDALGLWRGTPFEDFDGAVFDPVRRHLGDLRIEAIERRQRALLNLGRGHEGLALLRIGLADEPLNEHLAALAMQTHYHLGDQAIALAEYERIRRRLHDDLGCQPTPELQRLHLDILDHRLRPDDSIRPALKSPNAVVAVVATALRHQPGGRSVDNAQATEPIRELVERASVSTQLGLWDAAAETYLEALEGEAAAGNWTNVARICLRLAQITWDPELGKTVERHITKSLEHITDPVLAAQLRICNAGGTFRTGLESTARSADADPLGDFEIVKQFGLPVEIAWAAMRTRDALAGSISPRDSLALGESVAELSHLDPLIANQNARAVFSDLLRLDRRGAAGQIMRNLSPAGKITAESAVDAFGRLTVHNCWNLAIGRFHRVHLGLGHALEYRGRLSAATLDQVVLGQSYWLCREIGESASIDAHLGGALALAEQDAGNPLWLLAASLLAADLDRADQTLALFEAANNEFDLTALPPGSHRTGILAFTAEILASLTLAGHPVDRTFATRIRDELALDHNVGVLMGWPTVFIGSKRRFEGFAAFAANDHEAATDHFSAACTADRHMPPLQARSLLALSTVTADGADATFRALCIQQSLREHLSRLQT